jgi:hypothetical protein
VPTDKKAARVCVGRIRDVLNRAWDPIGGCPADEYDRYVGGLATMIGQDATDKQLIEYLKWAELEDLSLPPPFNRERAAKVVAALRGLSPLGIVPDKSRPS